MTNDEWEFTTFEWKPQERIVWTYSDTKANKIDRSGFLVIRSDAWNQSRSEILKSLQESLNQGWELVAEIGPDCWQEKITEYQKKTGTLGWICYIIVCLVFVFIPCLFMGMLTTDMVEYELTNFQVQLRRRKKTI